MDFGHFHGKIYLLIYSKNIAHGTCRQYIFLSKSKEDEKYGSWQWKKPEALKKKTENWMMALVVLMKKSRMWFKGRDCGWLRGMDSKRCGRHTSFGLEKKNV